MSLSPDDAKSMLEEIEQQEDARVLRALTVVWDEGNDDAFLWSVNGCSECGEPLEEGEVGLMMGEPLNTNKDCEHVAVKTFCSESCLDRSVDRWAESLPAGIDVFTAIHG